MRDRSTARVVARMLKENTGAAMCDSGGAYGRNWERNQKMRFSNRPSATLDASNGELIVTLDVYGWLVERLEYAPKMDGRFKQYQKDEDNRRDFDLSFMESFPADIGGELQGTVNTYNGEDWLSQVLQYVVFTHEKQTYILLQIHGGCDVRGGYTRPRAFRVDEGADCLLDNALASIICERKIDKAQLPLPTLEQVAERKVHAWTIEPGYSQGFSNEKDLRDFPFRELAAGEKPTPGAICYRESGEAYCPCCASPLKAYAEEASWHEYYG